MQDCHSLLTHKLSTHPQLSLFLTKAQLNALIQAFGTQLTEAITVTSATVLQELDYGAETLTDWVLIFVNSGWSQELELFSYQAEEDDVVFQVNLPSLERFNLPCAVSQDIQTSFTELMQKIDVLTKENEELHGKIAQYPPEEFLILQNRAAKAEELLELANQKIAELIAENAALKREKASARLPAPHIQTRLDEVQEVSAKPKNRDLSVEAAVSPPLALCQPPLLRPSVPGLTYRPFPLPTPPLPPFLQAKERTPPPANSVLKPKPFPYTVAKFKPVSVASSVSSDAAPPPKWGEITIIDPFGIKFPVDFSPAFTVENMKYKLVCKTHLPVVQQILAYKGEVLEDAHTFEHYGISTTAELSLSKRSARSCKSFYVQSTSDTHIIDYQQTMTCAEVKRKVEEETSIPADSLVLQSDGRVLEDGRTLKDYHVQRGGTIYLHVEPRTFQIVIRPKKGSVFTVAVTFLTTVAQTKQLIAKANPKFPVISQELLRETRILEDHEKLNEAKVKSDMTLELNYRRLTLVVQLPGNKETEIPCSFDTRVCDIKAKLESHCPLELQRLMYAEQILHDEAEVWECGVNDKSVLQLHRGFQGNKELQVRLDSGGLILMEYNNETKAGVVCEEAVRRFGLPAGPRELRHSGVVLQDEATLAAQCVQVGGTLYLTSPHS